MELQDSIYADYMYGPRLSQHSLAMTSYSDVKQETHSPGYGDEHTALSYLHDPSAYHHYNQLTMPVYSENCGSPADFLPMDCRSRFDMPKWGYKTHPTTVARRNERERNRVKHINSTFGLLRQRLPSGAKGKKMSKVETLRGAIRYIKHLQHILESQDWSLEFDVCSPPHSDTSPSYGSPLSPMATSGADTEPEVETETPVAVATADTEDRSPHNTPAAQTKPSSDRDARKIVKS